VKWVYLASRSAHETLLAARYRGLEVVRMGALPISTHANDRKTLSRCDAVLMTPDWQRSDGARAEAQFASDKGIPVFYALDELRAWTQIQMERRVG
jgi:nucleoside 2-deoxyribosyltransferase